ncbi:hypothetical protein [Deinococcus rufus]|uniref:Uncharacterized protein n=1 Tax=Deinococcus rufus TaxID=2136097 RepID=A0ABV7ZAE3_9DEIO
MEATKLDRLIEIDADGRLFGDAELLARLSNQTFIVKQEGMTFTLRPRRLHEIADPTERRKAFDEFIAKVGHPTGVSWPADYNVRDDIYD